jgi:DNA-binding protein YbaB
MISYVQLCFSSLLLWVSFQHGIVAFTLNKTPSYRVQQMTTTTASTSTSLNLFGGGGNKDKGNSGPGMMDQLAMFKKAQEIATKKRKLDEDLQKMVFTGTSSNNHVTVTMKYVPVINPMDPNPEYESTKFDFDDDYYNAVSTDDLAKDIQDAIANGIEATNKVVAEKYSTLQSDLMEALGGKMPGL